LEVEGGAIDVSDISDSIVRLFSSLNS
jgi:hypothetical protein